MTIATKIKHIAASMLLAFAATANAVTYTDGDLILGFRGTGASVTQCYEVNIGQARNFIGVASSTDIDLGGNINSDLEALFGSDWKTSGTVLWSVSGVRFNSQAAAPPLPAITAKTVFMSKAEETPGTKAIQSWTRVTQSTQQVTAGSVQALGTQFGNGTSTGQTESTVSTKAVIQNISQPNSYARYMPGGGQTIGSSAYETYVNGALGIENTFANGLNGSVLDLYQLAPATGAAVGTDATLLGAFRLGESGGTVSLTFSSDPSVFGSGPAPAQVAFSSAGYTINEDAGTVTVQLVRSVNMSSAFTVNVSTTDGTALAGTDFTAQTNVPVVFAASDTTKNLDIPILDRALFQGSRAFSVTMALASGTATLVTPTSATVTIAETDPQPATFTLSAATYSVVENGGSAALTINRTGSTSGALTVDIATANGTALAGTDYTAPATTVNFGDGDTSIIVNVNVADRAGFQGDRAFTATISNPSGGSVLGATTSASVTIQDNETLPSIALTSATFSVSETAGTVAIGLVRTGDVDTACSVGFTTSAGTAIAGSDYTTTSATVNFAASETTKTVNVPILDAAGFQGSRTFNATIGNPVLASVIAPSSAVVTITDNDSQPGGAVAGNYSGLIKSVPAPTVTNTGALTLKVSPTGGFTGKVFIGGTSLPVSGTFGADGVATFKGGGTTVPLALKTKPVTALGNFAMKIFADSITGSLTNNADVSNLTAERLVAYDGKTTIVPQTILDAVTKGYHTGVLPSEAQTSLANDRFPQGDGVVSFTVSKKGAFKAVGVLADGTKFSAASALNKLNSAPLFAQLYKKKAGLLAAELKFDSARTDSDALAANVLWIRPVDLVAKHYPQGWPTGVALDMLAARYRAPQKGDTTSAFPGLVGANTAVQLTAADGLLATPGTVVNNINISATNKVTNSPVTDKDFKVAFVSKKGTLSGFFTHTDLTKPKFAGIVFQKGPNAGGYGFFLSTKPKIGPTGESGGITLLAD